jgi:poly-gamma-glutamate capsule biosynthesis protein CapA/YwtB (metallophosphatase superfamily)
MRSLPVVIAATALALAAAGCNDDDDDREAAPRHAQTPVAPPTPAPTPPRPRKPRAVWLKIGVTGDLLPHLPIVARARTARGYDFRPMLRPIRPWVHANDLAFCHMETPLVAGTPVGYPRFSSPPALAHAVKATGFDACSTASNHSVDRGQAGIDSTRHALDRARLRHTGVFANPRQRRRPVVMRARGIRVALLAYTQMTNGLPLPHGWSVNLATAPRILADARRARRAGARVVIVNLHWGTEFVHTPDAFQTSLAKRLARSKAITAVVGQHAHVVQPIRRVGRLWVVFGEGNLLSNQTAACCPTASQDGMLVRLHVRVGPRRERVHRITYTPTYVRHPDYAVVRAPSASFARTVAVVGRKPRLWPQRSLKQHP